MNRSAGHGTILVAALLTVTAVMGATSAAQPDRVEVGGGTGITFLRGHAPDDLSAAGSCTLTTIGYDAAGDLVGLTNAHCEYRGAEQWLGDRVLLESEVAAGGPQAVIGTVDYISGGNPIVPGPNGAGLDYAVVRFDPAVVQPVATVGGTTIRAVGAPPLPGTPVCKQGATSGLTCGVELLTVGPYLVTTVPEIPGDSGSPVVVGDTLIGNQWVWGGGTSISAVLADLDRRGGVGAGFHPVAP
ncbi:chymotrypsin family serine protease [Nocardia stercoris]|uniref:Peptidase S1 n=1 Tax=Nocardia stercoris TaxID=2483361 RepID=A0A3M2LBJ7_9NOCA|nr:peptidase S1 [Nocardia stercoris]RMI34897.1 peptidase S1 [Nocardia stercoris]